MKSRKRRIILIVLTIILIAGVAVGWQYFSMMRPAVTKEYFLRLPTGGNTQTIFDSLRSGGAIKNMGTLRNTAAVLSLKNGYHPGSYRLKKGMSYLRVVRMVQRGLQTPINVTFNNIRTLDQLAGRLGQQLEPDSATFAQLLMAPETARSYGFDSRTFIAMFLPDTYQMYWNTSPETFVGRMNKEYDKFWNEDRLAKLAAIDMTRVQASTLASIVYEETKKSDEMPTVAGVYINRLRIGMKLQADPTVKFAVGDFTLRRIWERHLQTDSPYNTYQVTGLPPGPICMPSKKSIDAVLDYQKHEYLFFCAKPDFSGYHSFARTNAQHNTNRRLWQEALNRNRIR